MEDAAGAGRTAKILIVEDEAILAFYLVELLEDMGFVAVGPASNAKQAFELADSERPEVAIVDISVAAHRDGVDIGGELARRYGIALIFTSGHGDVADFPGVRELAPVAVLKKPWLPDQIEDAVTRAAALRADGLCRPNRGS
jgi:two-component system, response regulator PdtaR